MHEIVALGFPIFCSMNEETIPECACPQATVFMACAQEALVNCGAEDLNAIREGLAEKWQQVQDDFEETCG